MLETLEALEKSYQDLQQQLYDPEIVSDQQKVIAISKKVQGLEEAHQLYQEYKKVSSEQKEAEEIIATESDGDMIALAKEQLSAAQEQIPALEEKIKIALLPKDPNDDKNIFLEIRPAAGGDEAGLFAAELLKAYMLYAQTQGWKTEIIENQYSDIG